MNRKKAHAGPQASPQASMVTIRVNGKTVAAREGESVFAALTAAGIRSLSLSKTGEPRGGLCGMGVCYECRVTIDGVPDQQACMTLVKAGMTITLPGTGATE